MGHADAAGAILELQTPEAARAVAAALDGAAAAVVRKAELLRRQVVISPVGEAARAKRTHEALLRHEAELLKWAACTLRQPA